MSSEHVTLGKNTPEKFRILQFTKYSEKLLAAPFPEHVLVAAIAALCIQLEPSYRPLMTDVVKSIVPLVPLELGGAMRSAAEPSRAMIRMMLKAEQRGPLLASPHASAKSFSFAEYSSDADSHDPFNSL